MPDWYPLMKAAEWMKVAPWELLARPMIWTVWAQEAQAAEAHAKNPSFEMDL
jgi:hypothetical protein